MDGSVPLMPVAVATPRICSGCGFRVCLAHEISRKMGRHLLAPASPAKTPDCPRSRSAFVLRWVEVPFPLGPLLYIRQAVCARLCVFMTFRIVVRLFGCFV